MSQFFKGINTSIFNLVMISSVFAGLHYFPEIWFQWIPLIDTLLPIVLIITAVLAAYFNHSRITLLSVLFLVLYAAKTIDSTSAQWLIKNQDWLFLQNIFLLCCFSFLKDRGLISIHGLYRIVIILLISTLVFGWQSFNHWVMEMTAQQQLRSYQFIAPWLSYLFIKIPLFITLALLCWKSVRQASSFSAALLITGLFFTANHYHFLNIDWKISYFVFSLYYLLVVIVESYFLAYHDDLTGLPSRRALNQLTLSLGRKYCVAMLDIDHFKKFNDTYGHDVGDQVLKLVSEKISAVTNGGKAFRYGGEEFTIVFPRKDISQIMAALESVRQSIANYDVAIRAPVRSTKKSRSADKKRGHKIVRVTISIGVASRRSKENFNEALKRSDQALYRAKKSGRNKVSK